MILNYTIGFADNFNKKKHFFLIIFLFTICILDCFSQSAICSYQYRKRITFDPTKVSGPIDLTNFNALINISSDNDLRTVTNSGHVQNANGYDVIFTSEDGVTLLSFQMEKYSATTGLYTAWVKIPTLSTTYNTYIYMYYGNSAIATDQSTTAIWSNYYGVWHLQNSSFADNSGNGYTLTNNSTTNQSPAQINDGRANDGTDWLEVANTFPNITTNFTISGWAYTGDNTKAGQRIFADDENNSGGYALSIGDGGTGNIRFYSRNSNPVILDAPNNTIANNTWYYCVGVADITNSMKYIYVNGVLVASGSYTNAWGTDASNASLAGETAAGETANRLNGRIDEVHICKTNLSSDWIITEYNNQSSPSTFYSITSEPYRWTGGTSINWNTGSNWVGGSAPPSNSDVIITNGTNQPTLNVNKQIAAMWVQTGATVNLSNNTLSVRFDITNCGTITGSTGLITCNSTSSYIANQYFSGSGTFNLNNITVNNTFSSNPALRLLKDVNQSGLLTLTSGIVYTTSTNILALSNTASSTSGSATSFVSGPMSKDGNTDFVFPVGKGSWWRRASVTSLSASTTFRCEYFNIPYANTSPVSSPMSIVSYVEYWQLDRIVGSGNAKVTLYWEDASTSGITNCPDLTIAHWNGASWDERPATTSGGSTCSGTGSGTVVSTAVSTTFSPFTFGSYNNINPLPIELLNFNATPCNTNVCLNWATASETNNNYFTIEKSQDAVHYSFVNKQPGAGNSLSTREYSALDTNPFEGTSYYRLKQTDYNGAYKYSDVKQVDFESTTNVTFNAYPNPSDGNAINIVFGAYKQEQAQIEIYDFTGKLCFSKTIVAEADGENTSTLLPSQPLATGIYLINLRTQEASFTQKVIVK